MIAQVSHGKPVVGNWRGLSEKFPCQHMGARDSLNSMGARGGWRLYLTTDTGPIVFLAEKGQKLSRKIRRLPTTNTDIRICQMLFFVQLNILLLRNKISKQNI